jgi:hypothetical protein
MNAVSLARQTIQRLAQRATITEPLLVIESQRYTVDQLEPMLTNGDLLKMDGIETPTDAPDETGYRAAVRQEAPCYYAAMHFVKVVRSGQRTGRREIYLNVWPNLDTATPKIDVIAPDDWNVTVIRIVWQEELRGV